MAGEAGLEGLHPFRRGGGQSHWRESDDSYLQLSSHYVRRPGISGRDEEPSACSHQATGCVAGDRELGTNEDGGSPQADRGEVQAPV